MKEKVESPDVPKEETATGMTAFETNVLNAMMGGDYKKSSRNMSSLDQFAIALYAKGAAGFIDKELSDLRAELSKLQEQYDKDQIVFHEVIAERDKLKEENERLFKAFHDSEIKVDLLEAKLKSYLENK